MQHVRTIDREGKPAALDVAGVSHFYGHHDIARARSIGGIQVSSGI
ncbi:hypothetical protein [Manganibacter manganicus]|nr:hypothetical protein [Pseudaminobacter manganicus]